MNTPASRLKFVAFKGNFIALLSTEVCFQHSNILCDKKNRINTKNIVFDLEYIVKVTNFITHLH